ncbi:thioredoxin family protein [bacterium]|nr:thioredoxin family protein [bacterium]
MSEEFENENQECHCNEEGKETCTCGDDCNCEEIAEYDCCCSATEKLYVVSAIANIITTVLVAAIACYIFFNGLPTEQKEAKAKRPAVEQKRGDNGIFAKKSMSLEKAMKDKKTAIVLFYADWCPHCQNFAPTFKELEKDRTLRRNFNFVRLNSEDPASVKYMEEYGIQGFPSLFMVNPKTGEKQQVENYMMFGDEAKDTLIKMFNEFDGE